MLGTVRYYMAKAKTKKGLKVKVIILDKVYETVVSMPRQFKKTMKIVFDEVSPQVERSGRSPTSVKSGSRSGPVPKQLAPLAKARARLSRCSPGLKRSSELGRKHEVSRKSLNQQADTAEKALSAAFALSSRPNDVLFDRPVTKAWLRQLVLGLGARICHSSYRGVVELLRQPLRSSGSPWGPCTTSCTAPLLRPRRINQQYDLSTILIGLLDQDLPAARSRLGGGRCQILIFPLLAESGRASRRRYLGHPAAGTVDLGFAPRRNPPSPTSSPPGSVPGTRRFCLGVLDVADVLHAFGNHEIRGRLVRYLENRAYEAIDTRTKLERKQATAERGMAGRSSESGQAGSCMHGWSRPRRSRWLMRWRCRARRRRDDILSVAAGPEYAIRLRDPVGLRGGGILHPLSWPSGSDQASKPFRTFWKRGNCLQKQVRAPWPSLGISSWSPRSQQGAKANRKLTHGTYPFLPHPALQSFYSASTAPTPIKPSWSSSRGCILSPSGTAT